MLSGIPAQFMITSRCRRRRLLLWIARATSSLPVPDSPVMSTVLLVLAIDSIMRNSASIGSLRPMMFVNACVVLRARLRSTFSSRSRLDSRCCRIFSRSSSMLNGLVK